MSVVATCRSNAVSYVSRVTLALAVLGLSGCGNFLQKPARMTEQRNASHEGSKYQVIVVIAGGDGRSDLRMSSMVRQQLQDGGWQAVRRAGRWANEAEALADICPTGQTVSVDGVLFVYYDQLTLIDCRTRGPAYSVRGGDQLGIDQMANRLMNYLGSPEAASSQGAAASPQ